MKIEGYKLLTIDGNYSIKDCFYCKYKGAFITKKQMKTHRCLDRKCRQLEREPMSYLLGNLLVDKR